MEKQTGFTTLRLKETTVEKLRDWKDAIQKAHGRTYTWEEFVDICLDDLAMIDTPGAEIYEDILEEKEEIRKISKKFEKPLIR